MGVWLLARGWGQVDWTPESNPGPFGLGVWHPIHWRCGVFNLVLVAVPHCNRSLWTMRNHWGMRRPVCHLRPVWYIHGLRGAWRRYLIQHGWPQRKSALHALKAENQWNQIGRGAVLNGFIQTWDNGWAISGWISKAWRCAYLAGLLFLRKLYWIKLSCVRALTVGVFSYHLETIANCRFLVHLSELSGLSLPEESNLI